MRSFLILGAFLLSAACTQAPGLNNADIYNSIGSSSYGYSQTSGQLLVYPANGVVGLNATIQLSASGGQMPYVYGIVSGPGSINEDTGLYQASSAAGTVIIEVRDIRGQVGNATITVSAGVGTNQGGVGNGSLNYSPGLISLSIVQGSSVNCPANTSDVGVIQSTVDARTTCASKTYISSTSNVIVDAVITGGGSHNANPTCPEGYSASGAVFDCAGGACSGAQNVCIKVAPASTVSRYLTNFYVSNPGAHSASGPGCPYGYTVAGSVIDCGGGYCSGYQNFCKLTN